VFLSGCVLSSKLLFPTVNDLWVSKLKKADVPCDSSWMLNDSTGVVEVINNLNRSRSEIDKASPLLLQSFDFSTLYTKIDLVDLKARRNGTIRMQVCVQVTLEAGNSFKKPH
jgi:hypothetical protein